MLLDSSLQITCPRKQPTKLNKYSYTLKSAFTVLEQLGVHVFKLGFLILEVYQVKHDKQKIEQLGEERS